MGPIGSYALPDEKKERNAPPQLLNRGWERGESRYPTPHRRDWNNERGKAAAADETRPGSCRLISDRRREGREKEGGRSTAASGRRREKKESRMSPPREKGKQRSGK